jgi:hypothetical protein
MVAANRHRSFQLPALHQFVDRLAHHGALAVSEPADARGQPLKLNAIARKRQPAIQGLVFGKEFEREVVCLAYVFGVARKRDPAEWSFALAEERADVFRDKARNLEGVNAARIECLLAYIVAVIEGDSAAAPLTLWSARRKRAGQGVATLQPLRG